MTKVMKLRDWANTVFGDCAPKSDVTLRRWARDGKIMPRPKKVGRDYHVRADARYVNVNDPVSLAEMI